MKLLIAAPLHGTPCQVPGCPYSLWFDSVDGMSDVLKPRTTTYRCGDGHVVQVVTEESK